VIDSLRSSEDARTVAVIGDEKAKAVAGHLDESYDVTFLSDGDEVVEAAERAGVEARQVDPTDGHRLREHAAGIDLAVVGTARDRTTLLAAQLLRTTCDVDRVVVQVNDPANRDLFDGIDVQILEAWDLVAPSVEGALPDPGDI